MGSVAMVLALLGLWLPAAGSADGDNTPMERVQPQARSVRGPQMRWTLPLEPMAADAAPEPDEKPKQARV